jgi:hypothetical protein
MTYIPPLLSLASASLEQFLSLLPPDRVSREPGRIIVHADAGDAIWHQRGDRWLTAAPGFDTARRFGATGQFH